MILEDTQTMLSTHLREILRRDSGTRLGADPKELHQMRVATRRARAVLRAGRPLLDPRWSATLRAELGWLGNSLGEVRDLDVLLCHMREEAYTFADEEISAVRRVVQTLEAERKESRDALLQVL